MTKHGLGYLRRKDLPSSGKSFIVNGGRMFIYQERRIAAGKVSFVDAMRVSFIKTERRRCKGSYAQATAGVGKAQACASEACLGLLHRCMDDSPV